MAGLASEILRARVASAINDLDGWTESPLAWGVFGRDPAQIGPKQFAVGNPRSVNRDPKPERAGAVRLQWYETMIGVRLSWTLPLDGHVVAYDAGTAAGREVVAAVLAMSRAGVPGFTHVKAAQAVEATGKYLLIDLEFLALHMMPTGS